MFRRNISGRFEKRNCPSYVRYNQTCSPSESRFVSFFVNFPSASNSFSRSKYRRSAHNKTFDNFYVNNRFPPMWSTKTDDNLPSRRYPSLPPPTILDFFPRVRHGNITVRFDGPVDPWSVVSNADNIRPLPGPTLFGQTIRFVVSTLT